MKRVKALNNKTDEYLFLIDYDINRYYLGPASWPQWLLKLIPFGSYFKKAAFFHDRGYAIPCSLPVKRHIDTAFLSDMLDIINQGKSWRMGGLKRLFAYLYFWLVLIFGCYFYRAKYQEKQLVKLIRKHNTAITKEMKKMGLDMVGVENNGKKE